MLGHPSKAKARYHSLHLLPLERSASQVLEAAYFTVGVRLCLIYWVTKGAIFKWFSEQEEALQHKQLCYLGHIFWQRPWYQRCMGLKGCDGDSGKLQ